MEVTVQHIFDIDPSAYWGELFFDPGYQCSLHMEGLGCPMARIEELVEEASGEIRQRIRIEPNVPLPGPLRQVLGDRVTYVEDGVFDPVEELYSFAIIPSTLRDRCTILGRLWIKPLPDDRVERFCTLSVQVNVRGFGKILEKFIAKSYKSNIDTAAEYTTRYLAERSTG